MYAPAHLAKLTVVGQLNHAFPMTIVAGDAHAPIDLTWLVGKVVLAPGAGGSAPYEFTAGLVREQGLDVAATRWVRDLRRRCSPSCTGEVLAMQSSSTSSPRSNSRRPVPAPSSSATSTPAAFMPNSVYYTRTDRVAELGDRVDRFVDGVDAGMALIRAGRAEAAIDQVLALAGPRRTRHCCAARSTRWSQAASGTPPSSTVRPPTAGCGSSKRADWSALHQPRDTAGIPHRRYRSMTLTLDGRQLTELVRAVDAVGAVEAIHRDLGTGAMAQHAPMALTGTDDTVFPAN